MVEPQRTPAQARKDARRSSDALIPVRPEDMTGAIRRRMEPTERGLRLLNPTNKGEDEIADSFRRQPRMRYAAMRAHQEMAAMALATGSTQKMAASYAGVAQRQIKKYMADPDFRARIEELRAVLASKIKGKIMRELNRRVTGPRIKNMETLEMLRIFDRVTIGGKGNAIKVEGDINVNNSYDQILNALFASDTEGDVVDFPQYGDPSTTIPGSSTPVES